MSMTFLSTIAQEDKHKNRRPTLRGEMKYEQCIVNIIICILKEGIAY